LKKISSGIIHDTVRGRADLMQHSTSTILVLNYVFPLEAHLSSIFPYLEHVTRSSQPIVTNIDNDWYLHSYLKLWVIRKPKYLF